MNNSRDQYYAGMKNGGPLLDTSPDRQLDFIKSQGNQSMATYGQNQNNLVSARNQANMNKSAIVTKQNNLNLPEKLLRMKERVRRDRSANSNVGSQKSQDGDARSTSLYGRQKMTTNLDTETQKLRESYGRHRSTNRLDQKRLSKQNFKEDPFDREEALAKSRGSASYDRQPYMQASDKENQNQLQQSLALQDQSESAQNQRNRYKRSQMRSHQNLALYQQKYEKMEQNFKKFSNSIKRPDQSEQTIQDLKYKTGLSIIDQTCNKGDFQCKRRALKMWRLNSGLAQKQYENQEKTMVLARAAQKMYMKTMNHVKIQYYQKWKKLTFASNNDGHPAQFRERLVNKLSEMVTSTEDFNRCVDNDLYLSQILNQKIFELLQGVGGVVASDLFFTANDQLKTYNDTTCEQVAHNIDTVISHSVLGEMIQERRMISTRDRVSNDPSFNREIDLPVNQEKIIQMNQEENNSYNKIRGLSVVAIQVNDICILRLYFACQRDKSLRSPTSFQLRQLNCVSQILPLFLQRIFDVRSQINNLAGNNISKTQELDELSSYNTINRVLKDYHSKLVSDEIIQSSTQNLLSYTQMEVENFISDYFQLNNVVLRQIVQRNPKNGRTQNLLEDDGRKGDLVRQSDHLQENNEILEDFLDYKKEYYVHQISVCPIVYSEALSDANLSMNQTQFHQYSDLTFIFHLKNEYNADSKPLNTSALVNLSTSINTNIAGANQTYRQGAQKKHLDDAVKHKVCYYLRNLIPIIQQSLLVTSNLKPQIQQLEKAITLGHVQQEVQVFLQKYISEQSLIEEGDFERFYFKFANGVYEALKAFGLVVDSENNYDENDQAQGYFTLLNQYAFHRSNSSRLGQFQFHSFLSDHQIEIFKNLVTSGTHRKPFDKKGSEYKVYNNLGSPTEFKEIGVSSEILPQQIQIKQNKGVFEILLPLVNKEHHHTMALLIFQVNQTPEMSYEQIQTEVNSLNVFLTQVMIDLLAKRHSFQLLQEKYDKLLDKLEGEKITQETKDLIDEALIIPFIKKQTLKSIGEGIDALSDRLVTNVGDNLDQPGQEISQIAYISNKIFIEDVRLLQSYNQNRVGKDSSNDPDQMLFQSYKQKQQIVYEDQVLDKVVVLYPILSQGAAAASRLHQSGPISRFSVADEVAMILRFNLNRDNKVQQKLKNINFQLISCIQPVIQAALHNGEILIKQQLALKKLSGVIDRYKNQNYREIIYFMRDLKAKNVYNFSRSRLYDKLKKSKRYFELKKQMQSEDPENSKYFDQDERHLEENQLIQHMIRQALKIMNKRAFLYKQSYFKKFMIGTSKPVYASLSKKKKRSVCSIAKLYSNVTMRDLFTTFAVNTQLYKHLSHPKTKFVASVKCIFRNYRIISERLAFLKLKKNLNLQLRESMQSYQEADKDLFIQLNQILISSHHQQGGLEGGFSYAIGEIFGYLKDLTSQEQFMQNVKGIANNNGVGHIDEAVMTMKSQVYTSHKGVAMNSLNNSTQQKTRIFINQYFDPNSHQMTQKRSRALRISCDSQTNLQIGQKDQLLNQINANNVDQGFDNDTIYNGDNDYQNEMQQQVFQQFTISSKRDLIHQMLKKSNGIIFNFQNIQLSLSDIFLSQQSQHRDQNIGNRFAIIRRSKSSLIIPLFDISQSIIVGSLELYRHHQQPFSEDIEARYEYLAKRLSDFFQLYGQLKAQSYQISQLKVQMQKNFRPTQSLSHLLKNVYVNAPGNHFSGASHVLPIIILNQCSKSYDGEMSHSFLQDAYSDTYLYQNKKLAFFYQFKDNHIYNFEYDGTFIDELMENGCILEMCQKNSMKPDEGRGLVSQAISDIQSTHRSGAAPSAYSQDRQNDFAGGLVSQRHRTIESQSEKVKSVTNELFKHIIYYPIFDLHDESKIIGIFEVGFKKRDEAYTQRIITDDHQDYLNQFRSKLAQFKVRLGSFSRSLENVFLRRNEKRTCKAFQDWKQMMIFCKYKEQFQNNQFQALQNQENCYSDYMQNLDTYNNQLQNANQDKQRLQSQVNQYAVEKTAKLKFLATSLVSSANLFKKLKLQRQKEALLKWQYNVSIRKIAETAFTRVLELNHRHSKARFKTGVFLLKSLMDQYSIQDAFNCVLQAAHMRRANYRRDRFGFGDNSRSRSRVSCGENSYMLQNFSSLLSPNNMKKIERRNLYEQQINSVYTPVSNAQNQNNSAIINPRVLFTTQNTDGSAPLIQLRPEEVVRQKSDNSKHDKNRSKSASRLDVSTATVSKYSLKNTNTQMHLTTQNPYSDVNVSQIQYTQLKRDYSPIITTSKYDLKKIYDPQGQRRMKQSNTSMTHQVSRSAENCRVAQKRMSAPPTKADLQKQLNLKHKQMNLVKKSLKKVQGKSKQARQPSRTTTPQIYDQSKPFLKATSNHGNGRADDTHRTGSFSSDQGSNRDHHYKTASMPHRGIIDVHDPKVTYISQNITNIDQQYEPIQKPTWPSQLKVKDHSQRSRSPIHGTSYDFAPEVKKYQHINGRDVSPPVKLPSKNSITKNEEDEAKQRAARNIITALHQRYDDLSDN